MPYYGGFMDINRTTKLIKWVNRRYPIKEDGDMNGRAFHILLLLAVKENANVLLRLSKS